jgi:glycosyltransferase involved in cell wall biosynthesis
MNDLPADRPSSADPPILGFILFGGSLSGALVRDVRLANELVDRGYRVHVWWAMDRQKTTTLDPRITQHWLFHGLRFWSRHARGAHEVIGRTLNSMFSDPARAHGLQQRPAILQRVMERLMHRVCDGVEHEHAVVNRLARGLSSTGVTHVLPMLEFLCPWVAAARRRVSHEVKYVVTFQGYELYSTYARSIKREADLYQQLVRAVDESNWPAIAVSEDYLHRVVEEVGVPASSLRAIPPGVPAATPMNRARAHELILSKFVDFTPDLPLISYLGRRDTEKGIDLLLYALAILRRRGYRLQIAVCGPSLWGDDYGKVCRKIAEELRCPVMWRRFIPDEVRTALFTGSRCVVYPSIHREPFGMVAAEVVAHGTPAIVPDYGGVASAIEANGLVAGLRFKAWDSGDLATQIARLIDDHELHARLSASGPAVAEFFSIKNLGDRVLAHLGLPLHA